MNPQRLEPAPSLTATLFFRRGSPSETSARERPASSTTCQDAAALTDADEPNFDATRSTSSHLDKKEGEGEGEGGGCARTDGKRATGSFQLSLRIGSGDPQVGPIR
jgi:hypothetical protein